VWTEVWTNLWTVSSHLNPPPPPLHKGFGGGPEPDYPPPTMCSAGSLARVLVFGYAAGAGLERSSLGVGVRIGFKVGLGSRVNGKVNGNDG
jgi:hypothetical protein